MVKATHRENLILTTSRAYASQFTLLVCSNCYFGIFYFPVGTGFITAGVNRALNYSDLIRVTRISGPDSGDSDKTTYHSDFINIIQKSPDSLTENLIQSSLCNLTGRIWQNLISSNIHSPLNILFLIIVVKI